MRSVVFSLMSCLAIGLNAAPLAAASCPSNSLSALSSSITVVDARQSLNANHVCPPYGGYAYASAEYNLIVGSCNVSTSGFAECGADAAVSTHDVFKLVGPASPSALTFSARLQVGASWSAPGVFSSADGNASLREGDSNAQGYSIGMGQPTHATLEITITRSVGESFDLYTDLDASAFGLSSSVSLAGALSFAGLPSPYAVVSCQGYVSDPAVPVRGTSWGRLKTIYR